MLLVLYLGFGIGVYLKGILRFVAWVVCVAGEATFCDLHLKFA